MGMVNTLASGERCIPPAKGYSVYFPSQGTLKLYQLMLVCRCLVSNGIYLKATGFLHFTVNIYDNMHVTVARQVHWGVGAGRGQEDGYCVRFHLNATF